MSCWSVISHMNVKIYEHISQYHYCPPFVPRPPEQFFSLSSPVKLVYLSYQSLHSSWTLLAITRQNVLCNSLHHVLNFVLSFLLSLSSLVHCFSNTLNLYFFRVKYHDSYPTKSFCIHTTYEYSNFQTGHVTFKDFYLKAGRKDKWKQGLTVLNILLFIANLIFFCPNC
jgi:hypothetical protein